MYVHWLPGSCSLPVLRFSQRCNREFGLLLGTTSLGRWFLKFRMVIGSVVLMDPWRWRLLVPSNCWRPFTQLHDVPFHLLLWLLEIQLCILPLSMSAMKAQALLNSVSRCMQPVSWSQFLQYACCITSRYILPFLVANAQHLKRLSFGGLIWNGCLGEGEGLLTSRLSYWYLGHYMLDMEPL